MTATAVERKSAPNDIERKVAEGATVTEAMAEVKAALDKTQRENADKWNQLAEIKAAFDKQAASAESAENAARQTRDEIKAVLDRIGPLEEAVRKGFRPGAGASSPVDLKSTVVSRFSEDKGLARLRAGEQSKARISFEELDTKSDLSQVEFKTITSAAGSGAALLQNERRPGIIEIPLRPLSIRDILPSRSTDAAAIEYVRESGFTNNAAMVAEGAAKPYSDIDFALQTVSVRTTAHLMKASVQILADAPGLASFAIRRGQGGLRIVEENQLLTGNGTGQNLTGLIPAATTFAHAGIPGGNASTQVDRIRWAALQVRKSFYAADTVVLNPHDWALIELLKDTQGAYLFSAFTQGAPRRLWGLNVVESDALAQGAFMVGNFSLAAEIADRQGITVDISTENVDDFEKNMVSVRVESRLALQIFRPASFVYGANLTGNLA